MSLRPLLDPKSPSLPKKNTKKLWERYQNNKVPFTSILKQKLRFWKKKKTWPFRRLWPQRLLTALRPPSCFYSYLQHRCSKQFLIYKPADRLIPVTQTNFKEIYKLQAGTMASSLEQLKKFTTVVADTGDFECKRGRWFFEGFAVCLE